MPQHIVTELPAKHNQVCFGAIVAISRTVRRHGHLLLNGRTHHFRTQTDICAAQIILTERKYEVLFEYLYNAIAFTTYNVR